MVGRKMTQITGAVAGSEELVFHAYDGATFTFMHVSDCCESVDINDIVGDVADLIGSPLLGAEEISSEGYAAPSGAESYTWTFYRFWTAKGTVTVRWLGESNGYYSESVDFVESLPSAN